MILRISRRRILEGGLTSFGLALAPRLARGQALSPTPSCGAATLESIEGPYFAPASPEKSDFLVPGWRGRTVELTGRVMTRACRPLARAFVDIWHADENGHYDEEGFRYRGHVYTGADGRFAVRTILPAPYPGRTRHYHFKIGAPGTPLFTTQTYFPLQQKNWDDDLFRSELLMQFAEEAGVMFAHYDFVLDA